MAGYVRRFTSFPSLSDITSIEGVDIVDLIPPGIFLGGVSGTVLLVGEWPGGPFNSPTVVEGDATIRDTFGGFSLSCVDPLSYSSGFVNPFSNGNSYCWLKGKRFKNVVVVRVNDTLAAGVKVQLTGTPTPLAQDVIIPAGTRVYSSGTPTQEFALAQSVRFAAGTNLATVAFTAFDPTSLSRGYTTRTVSGVPVRSVRNIAEGAVGNVNTANATDLFRAGIGAGTALPSIVVTVSTGALDGAAANGAVLTPITSGAYDTAYSNALASALPGAENCDDITIVGSARHSAAIRTAILAHASTASASGRGRISLLRAPIGTNRTTAVGSGDPGVGANRGDRAFYCYPHFVQRIDDLTTLDPTASISVPDILIGVDAAVASLCSLLDPEENIGQSTQDVVSGGLLSFIRSLEPGLTTSGQPTAWTVSDYQAFKAAGIMALRRDPQIAEWIIQSGVTSVDASTYPSLVPAKRRRMADQIEDDLASIAKKYNKKLRTTERIDSLVGDLADYLDTLLSESNPTQQRIAAYSIDATSGNTSALQGSGIFVIIVKVQLLDSLDYIVLQCTIGETVSIQTLEAA